MPDPKVDPYSDYTYKIKRPLSEEERKTLAEKHVPKLFDLGRRYLPNLDFTNGAPLRPEFLDAVRGGWLLDKENDRPDYDDIISGIGYGFGLLLEDRFAMQRYFIEDHEGLCVSMIKTQDDPCLEHKEISIPPFNYVAKRKETQNVEVFCDGIGAFEKLMVKS
jgi:hypothetical protein